MYSLSMRKSTSAVNSFVFLSLFFLSFAGVLCSSFFNVDYFLILLLFVLLLFIFLVNPNFLIRHIFIFYAMIGNILGVFVIDNSDIYLFEIETYSSRASSLPLLVFSYFILVMVVYFLDAKFPFGAKMSLINQKSDITVHFGNHFVFRFNFLKVLIWICLLLSLILFIKVFPHPFFSMKNVDRFLYREYYLPTLFVKLERVVSYCLPFIMLIIVRGKNKCALLTVLVYSLYLFWIGEKFGGYWLMVVYGCIVYSMEGENVPIPELRKCLFKVLFVLCSLVLVLFIHIYLNNSASFKSYFYQRVAQQGQLYWKIYQNEHHNPNQFNNLATEIDTFYRWDNSIENRYDHGIYKVMKLTTPIPRFWRKIDSKSRYTASTYASIYYYSKELGMIVFSVCIGCLYWFFLRLLLVSVNGLFLIDTFICIKLISVVFLILGMSEFNALFSFKFLLVFLVLLGIKLLRHFYNKVRDKSEFLLN